jgi:hypothetical protein
MNDTPETNALDCELHNPRVLSDRYSEMTEHACKLERERDEARKAMREAWLAMDEIDGTDRMVEWQNKNANILEGAK